MLVFIILISLIACIVAFAFVNDKGAMEDYLNRDDDW